MRICIIQRIFSTYRKPIFDSIATNFELTVIHGKNERGINQTTAPYSEEVGVIKYGLQESQVYIKAVRSILRKRPDIVIHEFSPSILTLHIVFILSKILKFKFVLWGHGYNHIKGFHPQNSLAAALRLFYLKRADAVILYGNEAKSVLSSYINPEKIFVAPNTLDTSSLKKIKEGLDKCGKAAIRNEIGMKNKYNMLYIGRMLKTKHPELLIEVYEKIKDKLNNNIGVHFIGDGEQVLSIHRMVEEKHYENNIFLHGPIHDDFLNGEYLYASDIMVMPGYVGLSVNHAFCFGCPVITFEQGYNGPFHSPEIEYLIHNNTGFQISNFDVDEMTKTIFDYLTNTGMQEEIKKNIEYTINNICSIEMMLKGFTDCFSWIARKNK